MLAAVGGGKEHRVRDEPGRSCRAVRVLENRLKTGLVYAPMPMPKRVGLTAVVSLGAIAAVFLGWLLVTQVGPDWLATFPLSDDEWHQCQALTYPGKLGPRPVFAYDRDDPMFRGWCRDRLAR